MNLAIERCLSLLLDRQSTERLSRLNRTAEALAHPWISAPSMGSPFPLPPISASWKVPLPRATLDRSTKWMRWKGSDRPAVARSCAYPPPLQSRAAQLPRYSASCSLAVDLSRAKSGMDEEPATIEWSSRAGTRGMNRSSLRSAEGEEEAEVVQDRCIVPWKWTGY